MCYARQSAHIDEDAFYAALKETACGGAAVGLLVGGAAAAALSATSVGIPVVVAVVATATAVGGGTGAAVVAVDKRRQELAMVADNVLAGYMCDHLQGEGLVKLEQGRSGQAVLRLCLG